MKVFLIHLTPFFYHNRNLGWASLVVQWLRIRLAMQGRPVGSLVGEDPTCCRETRPLPHNY